MKLNFVLYRIRHQTIKKDNKVSFLLTRMFHRMGRKKKRFAPKLNTFPDTHTCFSTFIPLNHSQALNNTKIVNAHFL